MGLTLLTGTGEGMPDEGGKGKGGGKALILLEKDVQ
jgi:hypothetical protein